MHPLVLVMLLFALCEVCFLKCGSCGRPLFPMQACYDREMKGPCSAIGSVRGHFAAAVGQKVPSPNQ